MNIQGFRKIPVLIPILTASYAVLPFLDGIAVFSATHGSTDWIEGFFTGNFTFNLVACWAAALAVYAVTTFSFYAFLFISTLSLIHYVMALGDADLYLAMGNFMMLTFWLWMTSVMLVSTIRIPYLNPQTKWWTQDERYRHILKGVMEHQGVFFPVVVLNVSDGGVFLKLDERVYEAVQTESTAEGRGSQDERRKYPWLPNPLLKPGEFEPALEQLERYPKEVCQKVHLRLAIHVDPAHPVTWEFVSMQAMAVWLSKPGSSFRYGLGLQFQKQSGQEKKIWKGFVKKLSKIPEKKIRP